MQRPLPQLTPPAPAPKQKWREPQDDVPPTLAQRERIKRLAERHVERTRPVPPLSLDELRDHADAILREHGLDDLFLEYTAVLVNNAVWRDTLAAVPFERRLLLVPKCLRPEDTCQAPFDEFGLLCKHCGQCSLQDLQEEAERLGYAVLIAEGSALVMKIIEQRKIEAVVGVSCLSVLERAFPYMESAAIPGVSIPLLQDDCRDTNVDLDWVWDVIHLTSDDKTHRMDLDTLRREVRTWFTPDELDRLMGPAESETEKIARDWLARDGKRWRPFLTACAHQALLDDPATPMGDELKKIAIAVECFHKASLVHDDIEDEDETRYDAPTVHAEHGTAVALNVGDLLLGEGYRLIGEVASLRGSQSFEGATDKAGSAALSVADALECSAVPPERIAAMFRAAAAGHRDLCLGQGAELCWARSPQPLKSAQVLEIFRRKTAPAFEVALRLGAIAGGADDATLETLGRYSENLGIAYQIRDDIDDWLGGDPGEGTSDAEAMRPTLLPAIAHEKTRGPDKELLAAFWRRETSGDDLKRVREIFREAGVYERADDLLDAYKEEAARCLRALGNPTLKGLLRRVMGKIFDDLRIEGWCSEHAASDAAGRPAGAQPVG